MRLVVVLQEVLAQQFMEIIMISTNVHNFGRIFPPLIQQGLDI
jgi:hypothetical protein